eukprot:s2582_g1.t1
MQLSKLFLCCLVWEARGADLLCQELFASASAASWDVAAVLRLFAPVSAQDAEPQAPRDVRPGRLQEDGDEGQLGITAGLGGAFTRTNNADVIVRAQICLIVNDPSLDRQHAEL